MPDGVVIIVIIHLQVSNLGLVSVANLDAASFGIGLPSQQVPAGPPGFTAQYMQSLTDLINDGRVQSSVNASITLNDGQLHPSVNASNTRQVCCVLAARGD
jgi:hypothetical protein